MSCRKKHAYRASLSLDSTPARGRPSRAEHKGLQVPALAQLNLRHRDDASDTGPCAACIHMHGCKILPLFKEPPKSAAVSLTSCSRPLRDQYLDLPAGWGVHQDAEAWRGRCHWALRIHRRQPVHRVQHGCRQGGYSQADFWGCGGTAPGGAPTRGGSPLDLLQCGPWPMHSEPLLYQSLWPFWYSFPCLTAVALSVLPVPQC